MAMILMMMLLTGVEAAGPEQQEMMETVKRTCYGFGSCGPLEPASDSNQELCSFRDSVSCMERSLEACRLLNFPSDVLASAEQKVAELREALKNRCHPDSPPTQPPPVSPASSVSSTSASSDTKLSTEKVQASTGEMRGTTAKSHAVLPSTTLFLHLLPLLLVTLFASGACVS